MPLKCLTDLGDRRAGPLLSEPVSSEESLAVSLNPKGGWEKELPSNI